VRSSKVVQVVPEQECEVGEVVQHKMAQEWHKAVVTVGRVDVLPALFAERDFKTRNQKQGTGCGVWCKGAGRSLRERRKSQWGHPPHGHPALRHTERPPFKI
jgi:hypothetical protein